MGGGVNIFWKTREIGLPSYSKIFTLWYRHWSAEGEREGERERERGKDRKRQRKREGRREKGGKRERGKGRKRKGGGRIGKRGRKAGRQEGRGPLYRQNFLTFRPVLLWLNQLGGELVSYINWAMTRGHPSGL
jgi:hypothetical protein